MNCTRDSRLFFYLLWTYILDDHSIFPAWGSFMTDNQKPKFNEWLVFGVLLGLAVFMYASIMYKIVNYGP